MSVLTNEKYLKFSKYVIMKLWWQILIIWKNIIKGVNSKIIRITLRKILLYIKNLFQFQVCVFM